MSGWVVGAVRLQVDVDTVTQLVRRDPVLAAVALFGAALVLVFLAALVRYLRRDRGDLLVRALSGRDELVVLMHPNPDPDAMAAALAVGRLAASVDADATLQYPGQIRHQENRAFETVLGLDLERIDDDTAIDGRDVVLVDHNEPRGFDGASDVDPYAVIDHHPGAGTGRRFTDVRPEYGACATILAEYLRERGWTTDTDPPDVSPDLATGLLYGILADTKHLTRGCTDAEFDAAAYLYPAADEELLDRIANPQVDAEVLEVKARAVANRVHDGPFLFSDIGTVSNVDAIAQAAEELLRMEGVTAAVVCGDHDGMLHVSGRSIDDRVHMGKTLESVVDDVPLADAGGHARMGGGQVSLEHMEGIGPSDGISRDALQEHVFDAMAGKR